MLRGLMKRNLSELSAVERPKKAKKVREPFWTDSIQPEYYFENGKA